MPETFKPIATALLCVSICVIGVTAQTAHKNKETSSPPAGQRTFSTTCAGCHGLDGRGGERAPNIAGNARLQRLSDAQILNIVSNGVVAKGMPAFRSLGATELHAVVTYLRMLQGQNKAQNLPGNPARGKTVFFGKADCSSCHMMQGEGGFLGSDLSSYGAVHSAEEILAVLVHPETSTAVSRKGTLVVTRDGQKFSGLIRNEDNFSLQLQTPDGAFHFFQRSDLQSLETEDHPIMPAGYSERLSRNELNDLVSYLINVGRTAKVDRRTKGNE